MTQDTTISPELFLQSSLRSRLPRAIYVGKDIYSVKLLP